MRVPVSWLREYVAWDRSVEELAELLSMSGSEVEGIDWVGARHDAANLALFRVGRVLTKERHPNADKLWLCTVDVGAAGGGVHQIVCGAQNFAAGDTVAVSLAGATLENGLKLRKASLRGVESDGMMLSEQELGFEQSSPGIIVLPAEWPVGAPLADHLPIAEPVLEIEVTPNRPDCLSVYGVAREVAAAARLPLAPPPVAEPPASGAPAAQAIAVEIADPDLCARYGARVVRGLTVGESPAWLKARLTHAGMRPINNVVDVTNYVMLAVGQPLHAFDAAKIRGARLIVRRAHAGERIVTLDGVDRPLRPDNLVIADTERALVIAGIFGAIDAEVDAATTDLVLEAATFSGPNIMRTSKEVGWRSEASARFEKGLDPCYVPLGLAMASRLFHELCGGAVAPGTIDVWGQRPPTPPRLHYRPSLSDGLLGLPIAAAEQADILARLECEVEPASEDEPIAEADLAVTPPPFRRDLERPVDLIEEVGRIHGFANLPETLPLRSEADRCADRRSARAPASRRRPRERRPRRDRGLLVRRRRRPRAARPGRRRSSRGARRARQPHERRAGGHAHHAAARPARCGRDQPGTPSRSRRPLRAGPRVPAAARRGDARAGARPQGHLPAVAARRARDARFGSLRSGRGRKLDGRRPAGRLLHDEGLRRAPVGRPRDRRRRLRALQRAAPASRQVGDPAARRRSLGSFGLLRPDVAARYGVEDRSVYVAELAVAPLAERGQAVALFEDLLTFPAASQDLAVVLDAGVPAAEVLTLVRRAGGKLLREAAVFDVYEGDQVPPGKRSLAVRLTLRAPDRTLTDKDITGVRRRCSPPRARARRGAALAALFGTDPNWGRIVRRQQPYRPGVRRSCIVCTTFHRRGGSAAVSSRRGAGWRA